MVAKMKVVVSVMNLSQ